MELQLSIVIPTRNRSTQLGQCLQSLASLEYPGDQFEIVVVDNGSTDETPDVVR